MKTQAHNMTENDDSEMISGIVDEMVEEIKEEDKIQEEKKEEVTIENKCNWCYETTPKIANRCSRCQKVYYCGRECQRKDWAAHKITCKKPVAEETEAPAATSTAVTKNYKQEDDPDFLGYIDSSKYSSTGISKTFPSAKQTSNGYSGYSGNTSYGSSYKSFNNYGGMSMYSDNSSWRNHRNYFA